MPVARCFRSFVRIAYVAMQIDFINKRQSRRMAVRNMGYRASIAVGADLIECLVLDFSAQGMQVDVPTAVSIPSQGIVLFRDQAYNYNIKHETIGEGTKRFGLSTSAIVDQKQFPLPGRTDRHLPNSSRSPESQRFRRSLSNFAVLAIVSIGTCAMCAFFCGHGTEAKDLYFRIFANQIARASIEQANERARKMNALAREVADNLEMTTSDFSDLAQSNQSSAAYSKTKNASTKKVDGDYDTVSFEEN